MKAWRITGRVWPVLRVPGMSSSGTMFRNLKIAVEGAKEPMPRVSKKLVMKPVRREAMEGVRLVAVLSALSQTAI
jgi:hypothetical protein